MAYKGKRRCFGAFHCKDCNRRWMSAYSWANTTQACQICNKHVLPYCQKPLRKPDGLDKSNKNKQHKADLCGKCKNLGYSCASVQHKAKVGE